MALTNTDTYNEYVHNGELVNYTISILSYDTAPPYGDISVYSVDSGDVYTILTEGADYTFQTLMGGRALPTGILLPDTIQLTAPTVVPTNDKIRIVRNTEQTQNNTIADKTVEVSLDKLTAHMQEIRVDVQSSSALKPLIDQNTQDIATESARVTAVENDNLAQQAQIDGNLSDIGVLTAGKADKTVTDSLDTRVTTAEGTIGSNTTLASAAMSKANQNETDIAALNLDQIQIGQNTADITALDTRVGQNESDISLLQATDTNHEGRIGALESNLLDAVINGTMDIVNNVTIPADVTYVDPSNPAVRIPLAYDADEYASVEIKFSIERKDDVTIQNGTGTLYMIWDGTQWFIDYGYLYGWNPDIDFSVDTDINNVGTIKYISSDFTGGNHVATIRFSSKAIGRGV